MIEVTLEWLLVPDGFSLVFPKWMIYWDFPTQLSLGFRENGLKRQRIAAVLSEKMYY